MNTEHEKLAIAEQYLLKRPFDGTCACRGLRFPSTPYQSEAGSSREPLVGSPDQRLCHTWVSARSTSASWSGSGARLRWTRARLSSLRSVLALRAAKSGRHPTSAALSIGLEPVKQRSHGPAVLRGSNGARQPVLRDDPESEDLLGLRGEILVVVDTEGVAGHDPDRNEPPVAGGGVGGAERIVRSAHEDGAAREPRGTTPVASRSPLAVRDRKALSRLQSARVEPVSSPHPTNTVP